MIDLPAKKLGRALESLKWALNSSTRPNSKIAILATGILEAQVLFDYYRDYIPPQWIKLEGIRKYILVNGSTIEVLTGDEFKSRKASEKLKVSSESDLNLN